MKEIPRLKEAGDCYEMCSHLWHFHEGHVVANALCVLVLAAACWWIYRPKATWSTLQLDGIDETAAETDRTEDSCEHDNDNNISNTPGVLPSANY